MYITYGKVFGGTPNILMFWIFPENGSISERTVNRAFSSKIQLYKHSALIKKKKKTNNNKSFSPYVPKLSIGFKLGSVHKGGAQNVTFHYIQAL